METSPRVGLDFYHLSENVHRARRKVFGEESPEGKTWADELMHVFKHGGLSYVAPGPWPLAPVN